MNIEELIEKKQGYHKSIFLYFLFFCFFSFIVFLCQNFLPASDFLGGILVPDVVHMSDTFDNIKIAGSEALLISNLIGVYFIYYIPWVTHPALSIFVNLIFIYFSIKFIYDIFVLNNIAGPLVCLSIVVNPYLYLAVTGPNKEIPITFATLYIVRYIIFKPKLGLIKSILIAIAVLFVRDGYSIILLLCIFIFSSRLSIKLMWKLGVLVAFVGAIVSEVVLSNLSIIARNAVVSDSISSDSKKSAFVGDSLSNSSNPAFVIVKQTIRMIYNWLTLSIFPAFSTVNGSMYVIGWAYWIFGILISVSILACIYILFSKRKDSIVECHRLKIAGIVVFLWATISISSYIQPRYLIPILPIAFGVLMSLGKNRRLLFCLTMSFISLSLITAYTIMGNPPAKATPEDLMPKNSSFLINPTEK